MIKIKNSNSKNSFILIDSEINQDFSPKKLYCQNNQINETFISNISSNSKIHNDKIIDVEEPLDSYEETVCIRREESNKFKENEENIVKKIFIHFNFFRKN